MTSSAPPPGGPPRPEFHDVIRDLAQQAREDDRKADEQARRLSTRRPVSLVIKIGLALVGAELVSLLVLTSQRKEIPARITRNPVLAKNNCSSAVYRTYWKIVAYIKDNDHPPARLDDLVPKYLDKLPFDPATGKQLEYSINGARFDVHCAGQAGRK